jgi:hypothetical protein
LDLKASEQQYTCKHGPISSLSWYSSFGFQPLEATWWTWRPCLKDKTAMQNLKLNLKEETVESPFWKEE